MDRKGFEDLFARHDQHFGESTSGSEIYNHRAGLLAYAETGEPYEVDFVGDKAIQDLEELLILLGIKEVDIQNILLTFYENKVSGYLAEIPARERPKNIKFRAAWLLDYIADYFAAYVDDVNDYIAGALLKIDNETVIAIVLSSDEIPDICEDCREDDLCLVNYHDGYCCEHSEYTYLQEAHAIVMDTSDAGKIDWYKGELA